MSRRHASTLALALVLVVCAAILVRGLRVDSDLGQFLPRAEDPVADLLIDELRDGPTARGLLIAVSGASSEQLAAVSRRLREGLSRDRRIRRIENGSRGMDAELRNWLVEHRYRLVPLPPDALGAESLQPRASRAAVRTGCQHGGASPDRGRARPHRRQPFGAAPVCASGLPGTQAWGVDEHGWA